MARIGFDPATANHATPKFTVGAKYHQGSKGYRYFRANDVGTVAIAPGTVVQFDAAGSEGEVTADISASADATAGRAAGIAVSTPTDRYYFFAQVSGFCDNITTDGNVAQGDFLLSGADGVADPFAAAADSSATVNAQSGRIFGQALAADASTTLSAAEIWCS